MAITTNDRSRKRLQWTVGILAAAPTISGVVEVLRGARGAPGNSPDVSATVDGELRYANVFKTAVGPVLLSQLSQIERSSVASLALGTIFVGGLARLLSWKQTGRPHPNAVAAIVLETAVVPALLVWQRRLSTRT
jgi:hypothetical protein